MTTIETIKEQAAAMRDAIESFLDTEGDNLDDDTSGYLYALEATANEFLGDVDGEEMPE